MKKLLVGTLILCGSFSQAFQANCGPDFVGPYQNWVASQFPALNADELEYIDTLFDPGDAIIWATYGQTRASLTEAMRNTLRFERFNFFRNADKFLDTYKKGHREHLERDAIFEMIVRSKHFREAFDAVALRGSLMVSEGFIMTEKIRLRYSVVSESDRAELRLKLLTVFYPAVAHQLNLLATEAASYGKWDQELLAKVVGHLEFWRIIIAEEQILGITTRLSGK